MSSSGLPNLPGPARDAAIISAIRAGEYDVSWSTISSNSGGHSAMFRVFADALKINGVRVTVSAWLEQTIADMLGCSLLTAKLADLLFAQRAVTLTPHTQTPDASMVTTAVMEEQSAWIDSQLPSSPSGIIQTLGKHWVIDNLFTTNSNTKGKAINYGWHMLSSKFQGTTWPKSVTLTDVWTVQNRGWAHAPQEVDYSQNCILVANDCIVDGEPTTLQAVFQDPNLANLANADGVLKTLRQPGVPLVPLVRPAPCVGADCPQLVTWTEGSQGLSKASFAPIAVVMGFAGFFGGRALRARIRL